MSSHEQMSLHLIIKITNNSRPLEFNLCTWMHNFFSYLSDKRVVQIINSHGSQFAKLWWWAIADGYLTWRRLAECSIPPKTIQSHQKIFHPIKKIFHPTKKYSILPKKYSIPPKSIPSHQKVFHHTYLEKTGWIEASAGDRWHLAPVRSVPRVRHPHVHHLRLLS